MFNKKVFVQVASIGMSFVIGGCSVLGSAQTNFAQFDAQHNLLEKIKNSKYGKNHPYVLSYVSQNWTPVNSNVEVNNLDIINVSQNIVLLGYGVDDLIRLKKEGVDVVKSMQNSSLGMSTLKDEIALSQVVVIGELIRVESDKSLDDGYKSTAVFKKVDILKGDIQGQHVLVRQISDFVEGGMAVGSDISPNSAGSQYLLFLSRSAYEINSGKRSSSYFISTLLPYEISNENLYPTGLGQQSGLKISDLKK